MSLLKHLRQNLTSLQTLFKKRKLTPTPGPTPTSTSTSTAPSPSAHPGEEGGAGHSGNTPAGNPPPPPPPSAAGSESRVKSTCVHHSDGVESDSEADTQDKGVSRCRCPGKSVVKPGKPAIIYTPEDFYGETRRGKGRTLDSSGIKHKSFPSTSQRGAEKERDGVATTAGGPRGRDSTGGQSSCSQEELMMEEMLSTLKTRGSLGRRRSRSRSRRSRAHQSSEGVGTLVVNNVRIIQTSYPRRETDSDDSNTSLGDLPLPFLNSSQPNTPVYSNQSDSSFHSVTASAGALTPLLSSPSGKEEEEEEGEGEVEEGEGEEEGGREDLTGGNSTEHNRSRTQDPLPAQEMQELTSYGPDEFVLDLLLAMCRGTWSDIL